LTIAACYLSPEGVVFGADSTSSIIQQAAPNQLSLHFFNHNQKLFEIGEDSTVGVVTWGLGALGNTSHRTLVAELGDSLGAQPPASVDDVAVRWANLFWQRYTAFINAPPFNFGALKAKPPFVVGAKVAAGARTEEEEKAFLSLSRDLVVGFCLGGYSLPDRTPKAFTVVFDPMLAAAPVPTAMLQSTIQWFGVPNMILRLMKGHDITLPEKILNSGKWAGTRQDLDTLLKGLELSHAMLPVRDAVDFVYTSIHSTIKAMKFSSLPQVCGGPIEVAVVTTDRKFRWVRHKSWTSAIEEV
jgi:hypothetical protein